MDLVEKLRLWGVAHAQARHAERDLARQTGGAASEKRLEALRLREHADRLHGEVYGELGRRRPEGKPHGS